MSSGRGSGAGYTSTAGSVGGGDISFSASNPTTPNIASPRELLAIRDMTRNHITTNDPNRRSMYIQSSGSPTGMLTHQSSDISHLTNLSPTMVNKSSNTGVDVSDSALYMYSSGSLQQQQKMHAASVGSNASLVYSESVLLGTDAAAANAAAVQYYQAAAANYAAVGITPQGPRQR